MKIVKYWQFHTAQPKSWESQNFERVNNLYKLIWIVVAEPALIRRLSICTFSWPLDFQCSVLSSVSVTAPVTWQLYTAVKTTWTQKHSRLLVGHRDTLQSISCLNHFSQHQSIFLPSNKVLSLVIHPEWAMKQSRGELIPLSLETNWPVYSEVYTGKN